MTTAALVVAAGRGTRAQGTSSLPKQYAEIGGRPLLWHAVSAFSGHNLISHVVVAIGTDDGARYEAAIGQATAKLRPPVIGGATRQSSVLAGLEALATLQPGKVLIHDAARPFVSAETISRVIAALDDHAGAIAAVPLADTLKRASPSGIIAETLERGNLWRAQTPQGFRFASILEAHRQAAAAGLTGLTDDAAVAEWRGLEVALVEDLGSNVKLTTADDLAAADLKLRSAMATGMETRTASGFDVHRFADGDHVWLGGVRIAHTHRLEGHSDADVVLHALTDALLGTIGAGDIGHHFPPSDPKWKGAPSHIFLDHAAALIRARGGRIVNVDVTILAEAPKVGPHRSAMQAEIGRVLGLSADRIGIKATTTEGLGFTGRREGIAAMATATVLLPAAAGEGSTA